MKAILALTLTIFISFATQTHAQQPIKAPFTQPEWVKPTQPFRIAGNLYYVGTYDLACYLITTPQGNILINTGTDTSLYLIKASIKSLGFKLSDTKILLATHAHFDHVGATAEMKKLTGAQLMINEKDAPLMENGDSTDYIMGGHGPMFEPAHVDRILHDHDTISLGGMYIIALHHPGHTPGATSFLFTVKDHKPPYTILIANMPTILDGTNLSGMPAYPNVGKDYAYTLNSLKKQKFDLWLSSHASQFDLHKKRPDNAPYNPMAFHAPAGYAKELNELQQAYNKKLKENK